MSHYFVHRGLGSSWVARMCLLVTAAVIVQSPDSASQELQEQSEAGSILSAYNSNLEALQRYDVLSRHQEQFVGENGLVLEKVVYVRQSIDRLANRAWVVRHRIKDDLEKSFQGARSKRVISTVAGVCTGKEAWVRDISSRKAHHVGKSVEVCLHHIPDVPCIDFIGKAKTRFPTPYFPDMNELRDRGSNLLRSGLASYELRPDGMIVSENDSIDTRWFIEMDRERLVPTSQRRIYHFDDGRKKEIHHESYKFADKEGIFVPVRIVGERRDRHRGPDGKSHEGRVLYEADFRWFSVNQEPSKNEYDRELLNDESKLMQLIDPDLMTNKE